MSTAKRPHPPRRWAASTPGTQVTVHMYNDAWAFISLNGNYGFCPLSVLQRSDGGNTSDPLEGYYRGQRRLHDCGGYDHVR